jgi:putative aldouronate transport system substrate-binding protein
VRLRYVLPAIATAAALTLAACAGDGGGDASGDDGDMSSQMQGAMESYEAGDQFTATEPLTFSILWTEWPELPITNSWEFFDVLEERTNVTLERTVIPLSDHVERRSLLISAGDAPQIIPLVYTGEERQFAASRAVLPVSDYIDHMPHFQQYVDEWDLQELIDTLRQDDGKLYMLPGLQEVSVPMFTLIVRKDIFDELGLEIPDTWEGFHEAFLEIKEAYPDTYPLQDGFEGHSLINYAARAFGTQAGWGFGNGVSGTRMPASMCSRPRPTSTGRWSSSSMASSTTVCSTPKRSPRLSTAWNVSSSRSPTRSPSPAPVTAERSSNGQQPSRRR